MRRAKTLGYALLAFAILTVAYARGIAQEDMNALKGVSLLRTKSSKMA